MTKSKKVYAPGLIALLSAICLTSFAFAQTTWWRTYGGPSVDYGYSVQQTTDGGYIITGSTYAPTEDVYLIKTNASGDTLWTRTYGDTGVDYGNSVQQTADGGYIITGAIEESSGTGNYNYDVYLIKANASGDTLWTRTYGGTNDDWGESVQQTTDGGYIITGSTYAPTKGVYLIKTNASGDTLWTRTYGDTDGGSGNSVQQTTDGGYVVISITDAGARLADIYLIKTNASDDTFWTRTYGGTSYDWGESVQQTTDGGYIITGLTNSFGAGNNVYLVKTNASGEALWTRTYGGIDSDGGYSVQQTTDGGYIIAGFTFSFGAGNADVYLIKTDSLGNVGIEEPLTRHPASPARFLIQPNPFTSFARVPEHEAEPFVLSNITGRRVAICKGDRVGEGLRPGVYFLSPVGLKPGKAARATIIKAAY